MTEPDEALKWARSQVPDGWYEVEEDLEWRAEAYRAGQAASAERIKALEEALEKADELCRVALPQFNWGASALDGNAIFILNEAPGIIRSALLKEADQ